MTAILGIHLGHDASAALIVNGRILAAVSEERFTREKLYFGFPHESVEYCLSFAGLDACEIEVIAIDTIELPGLLGEIEIRRRFARGRAKKLLRGLELAERVSRYFLGKGAPQGNGRGEKATRALLDGLVNLGFYENNVKVFDHHL